MLDVCLVVFDIRDIQAAHERVSVPHEVAMCPQVSANETFVMLVMEVEGLESLIIIFRCIES